MSPVTPSSSFRPFKQWFDYIAPGAALREGGVDMTYVTQPVWAKEKDNFRPVFNSGRLGAARDADRRGGETDFLKKNPELIRGIIQARRKGVEFIQKNPDEAAAIMAKEYKIAPAEAKAAIADILAVKGVYWSPGDFDYEGMPTMLSGLQLVKAIEPGPFDWSKVVDESYLPEDLRRQAEVLNLLLTPELVPSRRGRPGRSEARRRDRSTRTASAGAG